MAVNILGRAYIEVHADTKPFGKELKQSVAAISNAVEKEADASGRNMGRKITNGIQQQLTKAAPSLAQTASQGLQRGMAQATRQGGGFFSRLFSGGRSSLLRTAHKIGGQTGVSFVRGIGSVAGQALSGLGGLFSSIGASIGNVGNKSPLAPVIALGIPALIGAVISLASVLGPLLNVVGLIPGALGLVAAATLPVVIGFQGFSEAVGAIMSKDPEKIAEALKSLSPSARKVAIEFTKMVPFLKEIKKSAQENIFKSLVGVLPQVQRGLGLIVKIGFNKVTSSFGNFMRTLLLLAQNPQIQIFFKTMFKLAAFTFDTLTKPIESLLAAFAAIGTASAPFLERLIGGLGAGITHFADFLQESILSGDFDVFLQKFLTALDAAKEFGKSALNLIDALLGGPEEQQAARDFFDELLLDINALADFFRSDVGRSALRGLIVLAGAFVVALTGVVIVIGVIAAGIDRLAKALAAVINFLIRIDLLQRGTQSSVRRINVNRNPGGSPTGHAQGGIFETEHLARIAEGGRREVVIPLTDRSRAMALADRSGLTSMVSRNDVSVNVYIGDEQIQARVDKRVAAGIKGLTSAMKYGPRPIGIGG